MDNDTIAVGSFVASNASSDYTRHNCSTDQVSLFAVAIEAITTQCTKLLKLYL